MIWRNCEKIGIGVFHMNYTWVLSDPFSSLVLVQIFPWRLQSERNDWSSGNGIYARCTSMASFQYYIANWIRAECETAQAIVFLWDEMTCREEVGDKQVQDAWCNLVVQYCTHVTLITHSSLSLVVSLFSLFRHVISGWSSIDWVYTWITSTLPCINFSAIPFYHQRKRPSIIPKEAKDSPTFPLLLSLFRASLRVVSPLFLLHLKSLCCCSQMIRESSPERCKGSEGGGREGLSEGWGSTRVGRTNWSENDHS